MNEFEFIDHYLKRPKAKDADSRLLLGIGDDAATLAIDNTRFWHMSADTLVAGQHFFTFDPPEDVAYKALAVNFSDLAAMGATPKWALLALALPELNKNWLDPFFECFFAVLDASGVTLIGGDTVKGPLAINLTMVGESQNHRGLRRGDAKAGDEIWVTGKLGLAAAALYHHWGKVVLPAAEFSLCEKARLNPSLRYPFMVEARGLIHAAADISDGLIQDLGHILQASRVGSEVEIARVPTLTALHRYPDFSRDWMLSGGDDYELVFTAPAANREALQKLGAMHGVPLSQIGEVTAEKDYLLIDGTGQKMNPKHKGFDHFASY